MPPRDEAPEKVTKSFCTAPWLVSATVIVASPLLAENVTSPADVVSLIGVTSLTLSPSFIYAFKLVPKNRYLVPSSAIQPKSFLLVPKKVLVVFFAQPPIFSTKPLRNLTREPSNQPPALV